MIKSDWQIAVEKEASNLTIFYMAKNLNDDRYLHPPDNKK